LYSLILVASLFALSAAKNAPVATRLEGLLTPCVFCTYNTYFYATDGRNGQEISNCLS
jgi:hypothetical protein